ncbi:MAG: cobyrinate a,c-diamide synthase [Nitrospirae bacterium]|nr:cobyrinate a,c-diamide synthase [Nitrospirota bacterium]
MQGLVIAGTHSGCGKTTITIGLLAALKKKGLEVQPFKAGPDFIDAGLHRLITGRPSRNLDLWMCGKDAVTECFNSHIKDADVAVIEGVMGMYDGEYSTAMLADTLKVPVILVVDAYGMAESAGAVVRGFASFPNNFASAGLVQGVIFNRVASDEHYKRLKEGVQDVPVLGYLPRDPDFSIPHRHLGLAVAEEAPISDRGVDKLADVVIGHIDIDRLLEIANVSSFPSHGPAPLSPRPGPGAKIAVAYDKAFCFYYEDNFDLLRQAGAEIVFFSPLSSPELPEGIDALYIGGGYPELYAVTLSENAGMLASVKAWSDSGRPLYAECGGLMYLSQGIHDFDGNSFRMAGVFPFETRMKKGRSHLGYREIVLEESCILGKTGQKIRGHEFHYSEIIKGADPKDNNTGLIYSVSGRSGEELPEEGYRVKKTLASYVHIHFASSKTIAENILKYIREN